MALAILHPSSSMVEAALLSIAASLGMPLAVEGQTCTQLGATLTNPDGTQYNRFGSAVAVNSGIAVIGASQQSHDGLQFAGAAYVFAREGDSWNFVQQLVASDAQPNQVFGNSTAIEGDTALIGTYYGRGAYVFTLTDGKWSEQQKLTVPGIHWSEYLGSSVGLSGDTAILGAYGHDEPGMGNVGSALIFVRVDNAWSLQQVLSPPDGGSGDSFGMKVAISGDTAVVGAPGHDHNGLTHAGAAYVFVRTQGMWSFQQKLVPTDAATTDLFGNVAIDGDYIIAGAHGNDHQAGAEAGAAYAFKRVGETWVEQQKLIASDAAAGDSFGAHACMEGTTAVVGATHDDRDSITDAGSAYVYDLIGDQWVERTKLAPLDASTQSSFGLSIDIAGDLIAVGAYEQNNESGAVWIFDCAPRRCTGDIAPVGGDGIVDVDDLLLIINTWGACPQPPDPCSGDITSSGIVDVDDLLAVINSWGDCP